MKFQDALILAKKIEEELEELKDLKPGVQKVIPGLVKIRAEGDRWKLGVVLEKEAEG